VVGGLHANANHFYHGLFFIAYEWKATLNMRFLSVTSITVVLSVTGCTGISGVFHSYDETVEGGQSNSALSLSATDTSENIGSTRFIDMENKITANSIEIDRATEENSFLYSNLATVSDKLVETERLRADEQDILRNAIATLRGQVKQLKIVVKAQGNLLKRMQYELQAVNQAMLNQDSILRKIEEDIAFPIAYSLPTPPKGIVSSNVSSQVASEKSLTRSLPMLDLNMASAAALKKGLSLTREDAEAIVEHRPYKRVEELVSMNVISKGLFDRIHSQLLISSTTTQ